MFCLYKGSHHGSVSDILVKETPVKKQVENYHKFKQERLRLELWLKVIMDGILSLDIKPQNRKYTNLFGGRWISLT